MSEKAINERICEAYDKGRRDGEANERESAAYLRGLNKGMAITRKEEACKKEQKDGFVAILKEQQDFSDRILSLVDLSGGYLKYDPLQLQFRHLGIQVHEMQSKNYKECLYFCV